MSRLKLLIIGLDGAGPDLMEKFIRSGSMPNTAALVDRGAFGPLASTSPPVTFPAWTSFMTGATPSTHGIPDFTIREGYKIRFLGAADRKTPTLFEHIESCGLKVGTAWFPVTYPPLPLSGYQISGWDSPVTSHGDASFVHPPHLHTRLAEQFGGDHLSFDSVDEFSSDKDWYLETSASLPGHLEKKAEMASWLLDNCPVDVAAFYFGETDTAAHHFWAFHDPTSPRRPSHFEPALAETIEKVYRAADEAIGRLLANAPKDVHVLLLSDHGSMGSSNVGVHINRALENAGLLTFKKRIPMPVGAGAIRGKLVGMIPSHLRRTLFRLGGGLAPGLLESGVRFSGIDFTNTVAFSEELNYAPSIWFNQRGREPRGAMPFDSRDDTAARVEDALGGLTTAHGEKVVRRVIRREQLHTGDQAHIFPDLIVEFANINGHKPPCLPSNGKTGEAVAVLSGQSLLGRKGRSLPGCHSPHGIALVAGPGIGGPLDLGPDNIALHDLAPVVCGLLGLPLAGWFEGTAPGHLPSPFGGSKNGPHANEAVPSSGRQSYTRREEAVVESRLRKLGYLED